MKERKNRYLHKSPCNNYDKLDVFKIYNDEIKWSNLTKDKPDNYRIWTRPQTGLDRCFNHWSDCTIICQSRDHKHQNLKNTPRPPKNNSKASSLFCRRKDCDILERTGPLFWKQINAHTWHKGTVQLIWRTSEISCELVNLQQQRNQNRKRVGDVKR